jgi:orotate phosphoribosyltransferase
VTTPQDELTRLLSAHHGHFTMESGHHGDLWLDLELLFLRPRRLRPFVEALSARLSGYSIEAVCGPLTGGAFAAQAVASELDVEFSYAERLADPPGGTSGRVEYRIPGPLRPGLRGRRVGIIDDVINAGSAVRGTHGDLVSCGATPVVIGSLLTVGRLPPIFATEVGLPLESVGQLSGNLWRPSECPLCASHVPLQVVDLSA